MALRNDDLYKKHDQLIRLKKETYEKLYTRCRNIIKLTSDAGELLCIFVIPEFVFGSSYPIIDIVPCANYIMDRLTKANKHIKTIFFEPNIIFIDWRRESDMNLKKAYMPIKKNILAMTSSHQSETEKSTRNSNTSASTNSSSTSNKKKRR